jgi:hypothetical protein
MENGKRVNELLENGIHACFGKDTSRVELGRDTLAEAAALGRFDAYLYLGKSFEKTGDYISAAEAYGKGLAHRHRASAYRLALLHGKKLLPENDRDFYLKTIMRLAKEGHAPSRGYFFRERLRGSYGIRQIFFGVLTIIPEIIMISRDALIDSNSWKFQR